MDKLKEKIKSGVGVGCEWGVWGWGIGGVLCGGGRQKKGAKPEL